jgi:hypothetical protein
MLKLEVEYCQFKSFFRIWKLKPLKKNNQKFQKKSPLGCKLGWWLKNEIIFMGPLWINY